VFAAATLLSLAGIVSLVAPEPQHVRLLSVAHQDDAAPEGRPCFVRFPNGLAIFGTLVTESDRTVTLRFGGDVAIFERAILDEVEPDPEVLDRYAELRAALNDDDPVQLLRLAEWLFNRRLFEQAEAELALVAAVDPGNPDAGRLKLLIENQRLLDYGAARRLAGDQTPEPPDPQGPQEPDPRAPGQVPLLGPDQINLLKIYEIDLDNPPRLRVERADVEQFLEQYAGDERIPSTPEARQALLRKPAVEILELMFRLRARDHYNSVRVLGLPGSLETFRDDIHAGWLQNRCATNRCHGGESAGRLWLATQRPRTERTALTNFLILDRFTLADGTPLIDWDIPERSPLLQMGMARDRSRNPHPEVVVPALERGWRPVFQSEEDRQFELAVGWIESMYRPRPEYPITYEPPVPSGAIPPLEDIGKPGR